MEFDLGIGELRLTSAGLELEKEFKQNPTLGNLYKLFPFIETSEAIAERHHFLHWELEFAPVFKNRGGFDLIIGNPPWVKVQWEEAGILSEYDPHIAIRSISASDTMALRKGVFENHTSALQAYLQEFTDTVGMKSFLNAENNYPALHGVQTNLYKFFLPLAFRIASTKGVTGYLHPEGVFDDPAGGLLRSLIYPRLKVHAQFRNELMLFEEVGHPVMYGLAVYGTAKDQVSFKTIAKLLHPVTLEESLTVSDIDKPLPLERTEDDKWNLVGHPDRVVHVTDETLTLFASLYDEPGTSARAARLPTLYTRQFLSPILERLTNVAMSFGDTEFGTSRCWDESNAQREGIIVRKVAFPESATEVVYSAPFFFVGNPLNKSPRINCKSKGDYDNIDLTVAPEGYLSRSIYHRKAPIQHYLNGIRQWKGNLISDYWRIFARGMINTGSERTLISCIAPHKYQHIDPISSFAFSTANEVCNINGCWCSLPYDWFVKSTGKPRFLPETARLLPVLPDNPMIRSRALLLNCLNRDYAELWREAWDDAYLADGWLLRDPCLTDWKGHLAGGNEWRWETPLRTQLDRRQALVELDVIVTKALGLSLADLLLMYRVSFPTMRKYDADTFYDQNGRCVFSAKSGESYLSRQEWESIRDMKEGEFQKTITETVFSDTPTERTIIYKAPFFKKNREADYKEAWEMLEKRD